VANKKRLNFGKENPLIETNDLNKIHFTSFKHTERLLEKANKE